MQRLIFYFSLFNPLSTPIVPVLAGDTAVGKWLIDCAQDCCLPLSAVDGLA